MLENLRQVMGIIRLQLEEFKDSALDVNCTPFLRLRLTRLPMPRLASADADVKAILPVAGKVIVQLASSALTGGALHAGMRLSTSTKFH
ncbi:hypothetical protein [Paraburkholderia bannensis]|uniref:hypothetical protein n=1 Tax=Paraburkholderia bannensis TaxID=765414 RepID=UPI000487B079|nr:hypothetical protein [Paraburkholderia bannensis]